MDTNYRYTTTTHSFHKNAKLSFLFVLYIFSLAGILSGCSAVLGGKVSSSDNTVLFLSMSSQDNGILESIARSSAQNDSTRTIAPDYDFTNMLRLYLTGISDLDGTTIGPLPVDHQTITWQQQNLQATVSVNTNLELTSWSLTLWAVPSITQVQNLSHLQNGAALRGDTYIDLTHTTSCHFNMGTTGLSGTGGIQVTVAGSNNFPTAGFVSAGVGSQQNMGIYLTDYRGTVVQTITGTPVQLPSANFFVTGGSNPPQVTAPTSINFSQIPAGTYNLEIRLRLQSNGPIYVYSESIVIAPNMTNTKNLLVPDILGVVTAPTNLTATYKTNGEDKYKGVYQTRFQWQDNSNNELGFELELAQLDNGMSVPTLPTNDLEWQSFMTGADIISYGENVFESADYLSGSTMPNASELSLNLRLGKQYLARIRALGDGTQSHWTYMTLPTTGTGYSQFTGTTLSRFYISYNLNGGIYDSDGTGPTAPSTSDELLYFYCHENGQGIPILAPLGGGRDTQAFLLLNGIETWAGWLLGDLSEYPGEQAPYNYGFPENLILIANYNSSYPMNGAWLKINNRSVNPYPGAAITIPRSENNYTMHFDLTLPQDAHGITDFTYDAVTVIFSWPDTHGPLFVFDTNTSMIPGQTLRISVSTSGMLQGGYLMKIECRKGSSVSSMVANITMT